MSASEQNLPRNIEPAGTGEEHFDTLTQQWQSLYQRWMQAKVAYEQQLNTIDRLMIAHLSGEGSPPTKGLRQDADNLLYEMSEARGRLDQFIDENA